MPPSTTNQSDLPPDVQRLIKKAERRNATLNVRIDELEKKVEKIVGWTQEHGSGEEEDDPLPKPVRDAFDNVYRCAECQFEVIDGLCQSCGRKYALMEPAPEDSISTHNEALHPDRTSHRRSTTPLLDIGPHLVPPQYNGREQEYKALLARGATRLMCETFHLQYCPDTGIIAWADQDLFDEFTGEGMEQGDRWKIRLGRRIQLDEEDLDGSQFIEGLLEDALLFPLRSAFSYRVAERWHTVQILPGIWETKLMLDADDQVVGDSDDEDDDDDDELEDDDDNPDDNELYDPNMFPGLLDDCDAQEKCLEMADKALEGAEHSEDAHVIEQADYERTEEESSDEEENGSVDRRQSSDPGWMLSTHSPDAVWLPLDEAAGEESETLATPTPNGEDDEIETGQNDSADSDFDSDELLSGDEYVISWDYYRSYYGHPMD